jgi:hypothetical protein
MDIGESLGAIVCLVLPVLVLLWLLVSWLIRRKKKPTRRIQRYTLPPSPIVQMVKTATTSAAEMVENVATSATEMVQSLQTIETSIVAQVGVIAEMTVEAIGYFLARLRGSAGAPILRVGEKDGGATHVVVAGKTYTLDVGYQRQKPESYTGAKVDLVDPGEGVKLDILVEGAGLQISPQGEPALEIDAEQQAQTTFQVKSAKPGKTQLRVEFYQGAAWTQRIDVTLDVRSDEEVSTLESEALPGTALAEAVESSITSPPIVPDPVRRHLHLSIAFAPSEGRTFSARANNGRGWKKIDVSRRERDLAEVNDELRNALNTVRQYFGNQIELSEEETTSESYLQAIDELARRGNAAFKRLFPRPGDQEYIRQALAQSQSTANVEISTDSFFLPWELLYDSYDSESVSWRGFWGFQHNISCVLSNVRQKQSSIISTEDNPRITLFANPELKSVREREVPYFHGLCDEDRIQLWDWLESVPPEQDTASERELRRAFFEYSRKHKSEMAHFACHAVAKTKSTFNHYLELSNRLRIRLLDMEVDNYFIGGEPVVVLNACGTGIRDPLKTASFVHRLMMQGARGVLATECDVPDEFASVFVQHVYDRVLQGETFGEALLKARLDFLEQHRNPLGLLYSAYTSLETKLVREANP